jgi:hypothetical protein
MPRELSRSAGLAEPYRQLLGIVCGREGGSPLCATDHRAPQLPHA